MMYGKSLAKIAGLFFSGLAVGFALAQCLNYSHCCDDDGCTCCEDKPPLHVKPVPITKKTTQEENV